MSAEFPYKDPTLSTEERVNDLLRRMTLEEKAGLFFQTMTFYGPVSEANQAFRIPALQQMITKKHMNHFNVIGSMETAGQMAEWYNQAQELALKTRLGIPLTISTDPRHAFTDNPGTAMLAGPFSQWPETLGLAAIDDAELVETFADIARKEYLAVGIRMALHPQIDLATEPRWSRAGGTFGESAELTSRYVTAYIRGFQGKTLDAQSVATMTKHFPGGGPQKDGEDPHFAYGREQVYPGNNFEYHLEPFKAAIAAGTPAMMPYYGMPVGTEWEEVGFGFNKGILQDLLRDQLGFEGIICTDWGLLTDVEILGTDMPARAWGVEELSRPERMLKALQAGVDQFGGELCPDVLVALVNDGLVDESRIDASAKRLLALKFELGLFENPYVDVTAAGEIVGNSEFVAAGLQAQRDSIVLLKNEVAAGETRILPLAASPKVYVEGVNPTVAGQYATVVGSPQEADVAIIRVKAPFEDRGQGFEGFFHSGSLDFSAEEIERLQAIGAQVPTVLDVYLDRPAIVEPLLDSLSALTVNFGAADSALFDVLFGQQEPKGKLPFEIPSSMEAVEASSPDLPFDTEAPSFRFGQGIGFDGVALS